MMIPINFCQRGCASDRRDLFEATRLLANPWSARPAAASYVSFRKSFCTLDSSARLGVPRGVRGRRPERAFGVRQLGRSVKAGRGSPQNSAGPLPEGSGASPGSGRQERSGSRPVSRVLSRAAIHLGHTSPCASSDLPGSGAGHASRSPIWSCSGWGLPCHRCHHRRGALLPHLFTLTRMVRAVCFLWHFPWARAPQALPGTLPCGARTFLPADCAAKRLPGRLPPA